jgi:predicted nucleotidyltransferase
MNFDSTLISTIRDYFGNKPVLKAYLFGFVARDEADEENDVDILVVLDYSQPIGLEFIQMQLDLQDLLHQKVDLVSEKAVSEYIRPAIDQDKVLIYERSS